MRILVSCVTYYPTIGGADDFARMIAEELRDKGHDILVVTSQLEKHVEGKRFKSPPPANVSGIPVMRPTTFLLPGHVYPTWPGLKSAIRRFRPDVIHAFNLGYYSVDGVLGERDRVPILVSPTGGRPSHRGLLRFIRARTRTALLSTQVWTALSKHERGLLREMFPESPPIRILAPAVDPDEINRHCRDPLPDVPRGRRILYAGRLSKDKGILELLSLAKEDAIAGARFVLAGPDYGLGRIDAPPNVTITGPVDRNTLCALYRHCDVFCLPSYHEGFGIVLLEAMAAAKPVVAYDNTSQPELCRDGETGIIVPTGDKKALERALRVLLEETELARRLGEKGRVFAIRNFNRRDLAGKVEGIYREAIARFQARFT